MYQQLQPQQMMYQQPQPVYKQSTQHVARFSQNPNQGGRQMEYSVSHQVTQATPPAGSSLPQQQLQYGQNQPQYRP
jgi:hypothetical protein